MYSPRLMTTGGFRIDRPILLVGLMGAGKSTVGRRLARRLHSPFADSDEETEKAAGLSIREIFDRHGERRFRALEREAIARLVDGPPRVIASGGGAFIDAGTRALVLQRCLTIWIDAAIETLTRRLSGNEDRPLLAAGEPAIALARLAEQRRPLYAEAHLTVRGDSDDPDQVVEAIVVAITRWKAPA